MGKLFDTLEVLNPHEFGAMQGSLSSFSKRDLQVAATVLQVLEDNSLDTLLFKRYHRAVLQSEFLRSIGYFSAVTTPEAGRAIRDFERGLPRDVRKVLRKSRFRLSAFGWRRG